MSKSELGDERFKQILNEVFQNPKPSYLDDLIDTIGEPSDWKDMQKKVKKIFEFLGCYVEENYKVDGIRTLHYIDVYVEFHFAGNKYRIIIECKNWNSKVKKAQVATLKSIIDDIGVEKGIIVSKMGFQKGAYNLASFSNIELLTFDEIIKKVGKNIQKFQKTNLLDKIKNLRSPFDEFNYKMKEETEKLDLFWYPSTEGSNFNSSLYILERHIKELNNKKFPRKFIYSFISTKHEEVNKIANNSIEYLNLISHNLELIEDEYNRLKDKIFSE